ncbi:MAG: hypothetical protein AVDCRST_MAG53-362, partial [uncultured Solirubrobacteraceae bacterium]
APRRAQPARRIPDAELRLAYEGRAAALARRYRLRCRCRLPAHGRGQDALLRRAADQRGPRGADVHQREGAV